MFVHVVIGIGLERKENAGEKDVRYRCDAASFELMDCRGNAVAEIGAQIIHGRLRSVQVPVSHRVRRSSGGDDMHNL